MSLNIVKTNKTITLELLTVHTYGDQFIHSH